jgi:transcriptional regulator with XRE-family HTH domain
MDEKERRQALADFLRQHRASLSPYEVGLPGGVRRRTPGLRREEVAQLASMGTSWYVWLEQGRDVHPSAQILESLAQAFRLTPDERRRLFWLAGQALPPHTAPGAESVSPGLCQMLNDLDPLPAYVTGRRWDYLAWNRAANGIFSLSSASSPYERNIIWRLFTSQTIREHTPNWEQKVKASLAEFRAASARYPGDAAFDELIAELKAISPEFRRWWPHHEPNGSLDGHKVMRHPLLGRLEFEHVTLQVPSDPDVKVTIYTPVADTRVRLQALIEAGASYQLS